MKFFLPMICEPGINIAVLLLVHLYIHAVLKPAQSFFLHESIFH